MFKVALAAALTIGAASIAVAAPDDDKDKGGFRSLPMGGFVTDGVNPVYHPSMRGARDYGYAPNAAKPTKQKTTSSN
jgi:hypothetical protein